MWTRRDLKARGKVAFKANYWRCVLVALILILVVSAGAGYGARSAAEADNTEVTVESNLTEREQFFVVGMLLAMLTAAGAFVSLFDVLVFNPLEVGCNYFFVANSEDKAKVGKIGRGFSPYYWRTVGTMILRNIYICLWTLLLVIPGIIKWYSYAMVPYIIADEDDISPRQAITLSRKMMDGNKWKLFVLQLSFIGWFALSVLTFGLVGAFYTNPYYYSTMAQFYLTVKEEAEDRI